MRNYSVAIILACLCFSCTKIPLIEYVDPGKIPPSDFITRIQAKAISDIVCKHINDEKIPAIQITIMDSIGSAWNLSSGTADTKRTVVLTDDHVFRLASITKVFTAAVIFKLIEEGKLTLEDKLTKYFPDYINAGDVTLRNLLDHSSGIKDLLTLPDVLINSTFYTDKVWDINQIVETIAKKKLVFPTGTDHQYSNTNTVLLGLIAEQVTGKKINALYKEYLYNTAGIHNIRFLPSEVTPGMLISGYDRKLLPTPGIYEVTPKNTAWASSAYSCGALAGNTSETARFICNLFMGNILKMSSLIIMKSNEQATNPRDENLKYFGKGLFKYDINGNTYYGHEGIFVGFDNIACFREYDKKTIVIFANMSSYNKFELLTEIDHILK